MYMKWIIVQNGDVFEGTLEQFQDCFFSNADEDVVFDWAEKMDYNCTVIDVTEAEIESFLKEKNTTLPADYIKLHFDDTTKWEKDNPGDREFCCEFCGIYNASKPMCNKCQEE